jgi:cation-transporting P-type ATPase E
LAEETEIKGLTSAEVQDRIAKGLVNTDANVKTRTVKQIMYDNIVTLFNIVNVILACIVFTTGSYKNMLFMIIITANVLIGIIQELRSKRITDRLSIVAAGTVGVIRDGKHVEIHSEEIVQDDVIVLGRGDQVPADGEVVRGSCDANESLLTGESDLIHKEPGFKLMSGSFVNAGKVYVRVTAVGEQSYANKISAEAKQHKKVQSEIMDTLNKIVKYISIALPFVGAALFCSTYFLSEGSTFTACILSTVAALIGMIPEGLILLTSSVLCLAVIRLSKYQVLVQQLYCIETLARVDVLCLDKTGTITAGEMEVSAVEPFGQGTMDEADRVLASIAAADDDPNETANAIAERYAVGAFAGKEAVVTVKPMIATRLVPFSSDKKWSGAQFDDASYVMGAGQFVMRGSFEGAIADRVSELARDARVLVLARVDGFNANGDLVGSPEPIALVCIHDKIRPTAAQTIQYFKDQGVTVNVISGDDPRTVSGIAAKVGVEGADQYVDATTLITDEDVNEAMGKYHVFGRVKPEQKKQFVVALQNQGHTVAMTGDGVNDTLALKQANCSVAMASGSDAARNVAHLVLVDNDFASMPRVVAEGRRSINNLQRSASLFLVKTLFSITMAVLFVILPWQYPYQPIQMTLVSCMTIGIPSFVLALEPNHDRIKGNFLENVIVRAIPGAICVVLMVLTVNIIGHCFLNWSYEEISTLAVLLTAWMGIMLIIRLSLPFTPIRIALLVVVVLGMLIGSTFLHNLFAIYPLSTSMVITLIVLAAITAVVYHFLYTTIDSWHEKRQAQLV